MSQLCMFYVCTLYCLEGVFVIHVHGTIASICIVHLRTIDVNCFNSVQDKIKASQMGIAMLGACIGGTKVVYFGVLTVYGEYN